eukprot:TRINITY_DN63_c2_g1_i4.p1 TRINITY_DN63_c2_g1~~TRINITY_DN63_c2_g1_i4.p1  ORF type:complete len:525 (-),score=40.63 TRINITY_DN63_c2_g1_i4:266-1840(-)
MHNVVDFSTIIFLLVCTFSSIAFVTEGQQNNFTSSASPQFEAEYLDYSQFGEQCIVREWKEIDRECVNSRRRHLNIFSGNVADPSRWPYIASIQELQKNYGDPYPGCFQHFCGATLISKNLVMTAAHCLWTEGDDIRHPDTNKGRFLKDLYVAMAPACRHMRGLERIRVSRYFIPDDFQPGIPGSSKQGGDIAILMLEQSVQNDEIPVNIEGYDPEQVKQEELTVLGWGDIWFGDTDLSIRHLRSANLKYLDSTTCNDTLLERSEGSRQLDTQQEFCALNSQADTCRGDSGGPIIYADPNNDPQKDIQIGISSWGLGQCGVLQQQQPGVYTNITQHLKWIQDVKLLGSLREEFLKSSSANVIQDTLVSANPNTDSFQQLKDVIVETEESTQVVDELRKVLLDDQAQNIFTIDFVINQTIKNANISIFNQNKSNVGAYDSVPQFVLPSPKPIQLEELAPFYQSECPSQDCYGNILFCCTNFNPQVGQECIASGQDSPITFGGYCDNGSTQYWISDDQLLQCACRI